MNTMCYELFTRAIALGQKMLTLAQKLPLGLTPSDTEGINAVLDTRDAIFIAELNKNDHWQHGKWFMENKTGPSDHVHVRRRLKSQ